MTIGPKLATETFLVRQLPYLWNIDLAKWKTVAVLVATAKVQKTVTETTSKYSNISFSSFV